MSLSNNKMELFAQNIANGMSQSDAYRNSYNPKSTKDKTIWENASRLAREPEVKARIKEIQEASVLASLWDREKSVKAKLKAIKIAEEQREAVALVRASESLDKQYGFEVASKLDITTKGESIKPVIDISKLSDKALEEILAAKKDDLQ